MLKGGKFRAVIGVGSVNIDLMGLHEQIGFNKKFGELLNALGFPITVCLRPRTSNIEHYLAKISERYQEETHAGRRDFLREYRLFMEDLVAGKRVMDRPKWLIIPWDSGGTADFSGAKIGLDERCALIGGFLRRMGVDWYRLDDGELTELCYNYFNPLASEVQKWRPNYLHPAPIITGGGELGNG